MSHISHRPQRIRCGRGRSRVTRQRSYDGNGRSRPGPHSRRADNRYSWSGCERSYASPSALPADAQSLALTASTLSYYYTWPFTTRLCAVSTKTAKN